MLEFLRHTDHALFHFVNTGLANPVFDVLCPLFRHKFFWLPLYLLLAFIFYKRYGNKILLIGAFAALTVLLTDQLSSSLIKPLVHRLRPCNNFEVNARLLLDYCGAGYSFVSSHAANHFGIAMFLIPFLKHKKLAAALLFTWAFAIAFSQVYVGVHFPADVAGGAALGIFIGGLTALLAFKFIERNTRKN
ncbi:MAG: phosphatase PAP2 family protein [Chitinophagales bacterium]|nr:phosphatase PAP2 family protein [Chitinophagales bacterium]